MCLRLIDPTFYTYRSLTMAWNKTASKETFAVQYQAFFQDIFFHLVSSVSLKLWIKEGFNVDFVSLDNLRTLNFPLIDKDNELSVQRANDLNVLHKAFMGAIEKLMKVYGATRIASESANEMANKVKQLNTDLEGSSKP